MRTIFAYSCLALMLASCGSQRFSDTDRQARSRDAKIILEDTKHWVATAETQRAKAVSKEAISAVDEILHGTDEVRNKYRGSAIGPEAERYCLALATYFEMVKSNSGDREGAVGNVTKATMALQSVAEGKSP